MKPTGRLRQCEGGITRGPDSRSPRTAMLTSLLPTMILRLTGATRRRPSSSLSSRRRSTICTHAKIGSPPHC